MQKTQAVAETRSVLIVGAGIGGLTLATLLARAGLEVTVLEQAEEIADVGAGIQLGPNALNVLDKMQLIEALRPAAVEPDSAILRDYRTSQALLTTSLNPHSEQRYRHAYLHLHRADLLEVLLNAARESGVCIYLNSELRALSQHDTCVSALTQSQKYSADLVVGADGIRSAVRSHVIDDEAQFTGQTAWRALIPTERLSQPPSKDANVWIGPGRHLVAYYVRGGSFVNVVAVSERDAWVDQDWQLPAEAAQLRQTFSGWAPEVTHLLNAVNECFFWGLFDRPVPTRWFNDRIVLLGDACHPMLPFMAQGAAMAIEDAWVLGDALGSDTRGLGQALQHYQDIRRPRVAQVHRQSTRNAHTYHRSNGLATLARNGAFMLAERFPALTRSILDPLYGVDVTASSG